MANITVVVVLVVIGRDTHDESREISEMVETAEPFLVGSAAADGTISSGGSS